MKKLILHITFFAIFFITSCSKEGDTALQPFNKIIFEENFSKVQDNTDLNVAGWTNFAQVGTKRFTEQEFPLGSGQGYAQFTSFQSTQPVNIAWLVSPKIDMDKQEGELLTFTTAHSFLTSRENALELLVSTNFDGTNVATADWEIVPAKIVSPDIDRFDKFPSGQVSLSKFKGQLNFAFRVKGSGTNNNLDGTYQVDDIMMFYKVNDQN